MSINIEAVRNMKITSDYISSERSLRHFQLEAVSALQNALGCKRKFLLSMAMGSRKILLILAICKLFIKEGRAGKILIITERRELEAQTIDTFTKYLNDYMVKEFQVKEDSWKDAHIVVSTSQRLLHNHQYQTAIKSSDFDLVIFQDWTISSNKRKEFGGYLDGLTLGIMQSSSQLIIKNAEEQLLENYNFFGGVDDEYSFENALKDGVLSFSSLERNYQINTKDFSDSIQELNKVLGKFDNSLEMKLEKSDLKNLSNKLLVLNEQMKVEKLIKQHKISEEEITSLGYKKEQIEIFKNLLQDEDFFIEKKKEKNPVSEFGRNFLRKISGFLDTD